MDGSDVSCRPATTPAQAAAEKKRMEEVERKREQERQVRVIIYACVTWLVVPNGNYYY